MKIKKNENYNLDNEEDEEDFEVVEEKENFMKIMEKNNVHFISFF